MASRPLSFEVGYLVVNNVKHDPPRSRDGVVNLLPYNHSQVKCPASSRTITNHTDMVFEVYPFGLALALHVNMSLLPYPTLVSIMPILPSRGTLFK